MEELKSTAPKHGGNVIYNIKNSLFKKKVFVLKFFFCLEHVFI